MLGRVVYGESRLDDNITVPTVMWGERTKEWTAGSSTAHFLLSHVVDLLRWYFAPAEVTDVYAISRQEVLGYTPDVYDAFLTFDSGLKMRVKAEWIKHIDELVEFYMSFSGDAGTLIYNKRAGFACQEGWRANLSAKVDAAVLAGHQEARATRRRQCGGAHAPPDAHHRAALGRRRRSGHGLAEDRPQPRRHDGPRRPVHRRHPGGHGGAGSWHGNGPLPSHVDGLRQTQVIMAIIESSERGEPVSLR